MFQGLSIKNVGFLGSQGGKSFRYWRFRATSLGSNGIGNSMSEWRIISSSITSLVGKTITNIGGAFNVSYPITNINDGVAETSNGSNIGYVSSLDGYMDVYVDLGSVVTVLGYSIASQGTQNADSFNNPLSFEAYGSNDAINWVLVATFLSISPSYPNWNPGTYRQFIF